MILREQIGLAVLTTKRKVIAQVFVCQRDHDCLVLLRRRTRTIDDSDMLKNEDWSIDANEVRYATRLLCLRNGDRGKEQ